MRRVLSLWRGDLEAPRPTLLGLAERVTAETGVVVRDLRGRGQHGFILDARNRFIRLATAEGHSQSDVGRFLDRDPSSINHALRRGRSAQPEVRP